MWWFMRTRGDPFAGPAASYPNLRCLPPSDLLSILADRKETRETGTAFQALALGDHAPFSTIFSPLTSYIAMGLLLGDWLTEGDKLLNPGNVSIRSSTGQ